VDVALVQMALAVGTRLTRAGGSPIADETLNTTGQIYSRRCSPTIGPDRYPLIVEAAGALRAPDPMEKTQAFAAAPYLR
jgi:hypothetical protein